MISDTSQFVAHPTKYLDGHFWLYPYEDAHDDIHRAKYLGHTQYFRKAAVCIAAEMKIAHLDVSAVAYIPTSKMHREQRGYDHARLLARLVAKRLRRPLVDALLPGRPFVQTGHSRVDRQLAPRFIPICQLKYRTVLLIDDVATTRSTLNNAALALQHAGVQQVFAATIAYQSSKKYMRSAHDAHKQNHRVHHQFVS
jgi:predicted amidophosphoribosyltransferase